MVNRIPAFARSIGMRFRTRYPDWARPPSRPFSSFSAFLPSPNASAGAAGKPVAEPAISHDHIWVDTVKQGDLPIDVRALGTLTSRTMRPAG